MVRAIYLTQPENQASEEEEEVLGSADRPQAAVSLSYPPTGGATHNLSYYTRKYTVTPIVVGTVYLTQPENQATGEEEEEEEVLGSADWPQAAA